jgi:LmbE family N-acetylglucosaminyl deacetylase
MTILYVFPHPDDESFGPAPVLARQRRQNHQVHLLTLTRGEATTQREKLGYSLEEMGRVRTGEMQCVAEALDLTDLTVLDFPDGGLAEMDPRVLEQAVDTRIRQCRPQVVVTYAAHGISGHADHLAAHAIVKHAYCTIRAEKPGYLQRLAFMTLPEAGDDTDRPDHLRGSPPDAIDAVVPFSGDDRDHAEAALDCYETYQEVVAEHRPLDIVADGVCFEFFQEDADPPHDDLLAGLATNGK